MEHVKKENATKHIHSSGCVVYEYPMQNAAMNIGIAEIIRRYPEQGYALTVAKTILAQSTKETPIC